MDLLTTLSGMAPDTEAACTTAVGAAGCGPRDGADGSSEDFLAMLTSLLGPLPDDGDAAAELAAAVAELEDVDAGALDDAVASGWPLALLAAAETAARRPSIAENATVTGDDGAAEVDAEEELVGEVAGSEDGDAGVPRAVDADGDAEAGPVPDDADEGSEQAVREPTSARAEDATQDASPVPVDAETNDAVEGGPAATSDAGPARTTSSGGDAAPPAPVADADVLRGQQAAAATDADTDVDAPTAQRAVARPVAHAEPVADTARPSAGPVTEAPPAPQTSGSTGPTAATLGMADGVRRVLEAIELLENAPPPRQLTIEIGEARVRVSLEEGQVRLSVMDGGSDDIDELIAAAEDALAQQGFDLGGDGSDEGTPDGDPTTTTTSGGSRPRTSWSADRGLRL